MEKRMEPPEKVGPLVTEWHEIFRNKFREEQECTNYRSNIFAVPVSTLLRHYKAAPYENGLRGTALTLSHEGLFGHPQPGIGPVPHTPRALTASLGYPHA